MLIDVDNYFREETGWKDPDSFSKTLAQYHQLLWSRQPLQAFTIDKTCRLISDSRVYYSSDRMCPPFINKKASGFCHNFGNRMKFIDEMLSEGERKKFYLLSNTIGNRIIFPQTKINNLPTINQARGYGKTSYQTRDRFDLTLECIRKFYCYLITQDEVDGISPLFETLKRYSTFFKLFKNFKGYIDFFLLEALVDVNYKIKFFLDFDDFTSEGFVSLPTEDNYLRYKSNVEKFINQRNQDILYFSKKLEKEIFSNELKK